MSDTIINIEALNIVINLPTVQQTAEEKQAEFARLVRIERAARVAEQHLAIALARTATLREKVAYIRKQFEAITARAEARKLRQQSFR